MKTKTDIYSEVKKTEDVIKNLKKKLSNMSQMECIEYGDTVQKDLYINIGKLRCLNWIMGWESDNSW